MALGQSYFAHRKQITKCCSLREAFNGIRIKLRTKPIFRIFHILKINRIMPFCNLFMERPSYLRQKSRNQQRSIQIRF